MGLPFTSFHLKMFLLSLLSITTNAEYSVKAPNKLFSDICPKTKYPKMCFHILQISRKTRRASSLPSLGVGSLDIAIFQAKTSAYMLKILLKRKRNNSDKEKYEDCRDNYKFAEEKIREAKTKFRNNDFASARMCLEAASKVPISCQKEFGDSPAEVRKINETSDALFDIALVIVKELEHRKTTQTMAPYMKKK